MIFSLMHKNIPVITLDVDMDGNVLTLGDVHNNRFMPISTKLNPYLVKQWLKERAIPKTRSGIATVLENSKANSTQSLLIRNLGVSLNDCYWLKPVGSNIMWEDINLFNNDFNPSEQYDLITSRRTLVTLVVS